MTLDKQQQIEAAWAARRQQAAVEADEKALQIDWMWRDWQGDAELQDYLWSTYRGKLPTDWRQYLRNDPVADYEELYALED